MFRELIIHWWSNMLTLRKRDTLVECRRQCSTLLNFPWDHPFFYHTHSFLTHYFMHRYTPTTLPMLINLFVLVHAATGSTINCRGNPFFSWSIIYTCCSEHTTIVSNFTHSLNECLYRDTSPTPNQHIGFT